MHPIVWPDFAFCPYPPTKKIAKQWWLHFHASFFTSHGVPPKKIHHTFFQLGETEGWNIVPFQFCEAHLSCTGKAVGALEVLPFCRIAGGQRLGLKWSADCRCWSLILTTCGKRKWRLVKQTGGQEKERNTNFGWKLFFFACCCIFLAVYMCIYIYTYSFLKNHHTDLMRLPCLLENPRSPGWPSSSGQLQLFPQSSKDFGKYPQNIWDNAIP